TILTPDVMALLVDFAKQYDVEIFHDKLRLIDTRSKVYGKPEREAAVLSAAQALLDKLARPLERRKNNPDFWYASESMILIPDVMLKFGRHGVSSSTLALALLFGAVGLGFDVLGFWAFHAARLNDGVTPMFFIGVGLFFFPVCCAAVVAWDKWRWARLRRLQQRADYKYKLSR